MRRWTDPPPSRHGRAGNRAPRPAAARGLLLALAAGLLIGPDVRAQQGPTVRTVKGIEAMRLLYQRGEYARAAYFGYAEIWKDICKPDVLLLIGSSLERLGETEDAAVYYTLALRTLEFGKAADVRASARQIQAMLARVDAAHRQAKAQYAKTAAGKRFTSPRQVDDLWMSQVTCDLHCLHGLYAWKLVGGRKDARPDWIHNRQGRMHRSGMKYVDEVDGRKGVLFSVPVKAKTSPDADKWHRAILARLGHPTQITTANPGHCRFLRIGAKGYGFDFILKAYLAGREIFSQRIGTKDWADLKIDLQEAARPAGSPATAKSTTQPAAEAEAVTIELVVPKGQRWSEGVWIDYLDFFDD